MQITLNHFYNLILKLNLFTIHFKSLVDNLYESLDL